ncbi:rCG58327 [Rattus norvegicus]|uniref:Ischemia related factor vof-16 n=2 Tax=Rattus norvegicus TaxID=10116 RepID=Q8K4N0_RAT|nr:rCG58327 [Rattus norvegicus]BAC06858.1 ischemia related factor vof-16 [Rattus norvegicus]
MLASHVHCYGCLCIWLIRRLLDLFLESNTQYYRSVIPTAQCLVLGLRTSQLKSQHAPCLQLLSSTVNLKIVPN